MEGQKEPVFQPGAGQAQSHSPSAAVCVPASGAVQGSDHDSSHLQQGEAAGGVLEEALSSFPPAAPVPTFPGSAEGSGGCEAASPLTCEQSAFLWIFL